MLSFQDGVNFKKYKSFRFHRNIIYVQDVFDSDMYLKPSACKQMHNKHN